MKIWRFLMPRKRYRLVDKRKHPKVCYVVCPKHKKGEVMPKLHLCGSGCAPHLGAFRGTWFRLT